MATIRRFMYREDLVYLDHHLASEAEPARRQTLARRLKYELDELEAAEMRTITARQAYSASYWKARAARMRQASGLYRSQVVRDHLMQVADGYGSLAERAHTIQENAEEASAWCNALPTAEQSRSTHRRQAPNSCRDSAAKHRILRQIVAAST
jgi:hypothetical protein